MEERRRKGSLTELAVAKALLAKGYSVSFPYGENQRYDLVVEMNNGLKKVQCKHARYSEGKIVFQCSGTIGPYTNDADFFGVYSSEIDKAYLIPVSNVGINQCTLLVESTAKQYEI